MTAATTFDKTPGWLDWHPAPSKPNFTPPAGAVDAHCHVFGPGAQFPFAPERKYTPCDASKQQLFALRDQLGFARNVIVQATCHGADNRALVDALEHSNGRARGVATVNANVSDAALHELDRAGVRGVRFNFVKRLVDALPRAPLLEIARRIKPLGWHIVIYFEAQELPELYDFFASLPTTVVVDHMGRPDVTKPVAGPEFSLFLKLMREHENFWSKVTCPERLSKQGPPTYDDVVPFAQRVVEEFPERVLWGTDWPHPNMTSHMPDDGALVDFIPRIARTAALQQKLLVDNPMRLYWPEETPVSKDIQAYLAELEDIPGTRVYTAARARAGYWLNQFAMSLMKSENRARWLAQPESYLNEWPMSDAQKAAVLARDYNRLLELGGNIYFLAKVFATDGLSFVQAVSTMTGMSVEEYQKMMLAGGRSPEGVRSKKGGY